MDKKVPSFLCKQQNFIFKEHKILLFNFSCAILNLLGRFMLLYFLSAKEIWLRPAMRVHLRDSEATNAHTYEMINGEEVWLSITD